MLFPSVLIAISYVIAARLKSFRNLTDEIMYNSYDGVICTRLTDIQLNGMFWPKIWMTMVQRETEDHISPKVPNIHIKSIMFTIHQFLSMKRTR